MGVEDCRLHPNIKECQERLGYSVLYYPDNDRYSHFLLENLGNENWTFPEGPHRLSKFLFRTLVSHL